MAFRYLDLAERIYTYPGKQKRRQKGRPENGERRQETGGAGVVVVVIVVIVVVVVVVVVVTKFLMERCHPRDGGGPVPNRGGPWERPLAYRGGFW